MKKMKIFLPFALAALMLGMGACDKKQDQSGSPAKSNSSVAPLPKITVTASGSTKLLIGGTVKLTADKEGVTWVSADPKIAEVAADGTVTAKGYGTVAITAKKDGHTNGVISITVTRPDPTKVLNFEDADHYSADGWWENSSSGPGAQPVYNKTAASDGTCIAHFGNGDKETLSFSSDKAVKAELVVTMGHNSSYEPLSQIMTAKFNGADIDLSKVNYTSDDSSGNYTFQGVSFGEVNLKAEINSLEISMLGNAPYLDDLQIYAAEAANIQISKPAAKETLAITNAAENLTVEAESTLQLNCATAGVTWSSSNTDVATVDANGLVTGVAKGSANISVVKAGYISARVSIKVTEKLAAGEIRVEVESGTSPEDKVTFRQPYGGTETMTNAFPLETILTIKFNCSLPGAYNMSVNARNSNSDPIVITTAFEIKVNGNKVTAETEASGRTFAIYELGAVTLANGENTITVEAKSETLPNLDFFRFVPKA